MTQPHSPSVLSSQEVADIARLLIAIREDANRIEGILNRSTEKKDDDLDASNPLNKQGTNLSDRGIEVCYRMFDAGKSRYAVAQALQISHGAATHRFHAWEKLGGQNREQKPLH